jgi:hypothetical protein
VNKNRILYFINDTGNGSILNISVDPKNSDKLKKFYETLEKESPEKIEGEIIHGSSYTTLKVFFSVGIGKCEENIISFVSGIKNNN